MRPVLGSSSLFTLKVGHIFSIIIHLRFQILFLPSLRTRVSGKIGKAPKSGFAKFILKELIEKHFFLAAFKILCMSELTLRAAKCKPRCQFSLHIEVDLYALPTQYKTIFSVIGLLMGQLLVI